MTQYKGVATRARARCRRWILTSQSGVGMLWFPLKDVGVINWCQILHHNLTSDQSVLRVRATRSDFRSLGEFWISPRRPRFLGETTPIRRRIVTRQVRRQRVRCLRRVQRGWGSCGHPLTLTFSTARTSFLWHSQFPLC